MQSTIHLPMRNVHPHAHTYADMGSDKPPDIHTLTTKCTRRRTGRRDHVHMSGTHVHIATLAHMNAFTQTRADPCSHFCACTPLHACTE